MSIFLSDYCVLFFINQHSLDFTLAGLSTSAREPSTAPAASAWASRLSSGVETRGEELCNNDIMIPYRAVFCHVYFFIRLLCFVLYQSTLSRLYFGRAQHKRSRNCHRAKAVCRAESRQEGEKLEKKGNPSSELINKLDLCRLADKH